MNRDLRDKEADMSASPIEVVGKWLENLLDPDFVNRVVAPDATYVSLNTEDAELNKIMPWAGTSHGPQAFLDNLGAMFSRWENQAFNVTTMFAWARTWPYSATSATGRTRWARWRVPRSHPREGRRREGDPPAVPRGQLRHRSEASATTVRGPSRPRSARSRSRSALRNEPGLQQSSELGRRRQSGSSSRMDVGEELRMAEDKVGVTEAEKLAAQQGPIMQRN